MLEPKLMNHGWELYFKFFFTSYRNVVQEEGVEGIDWINLTT